MNVSPQFVGRVTPLLYSGWRERYRPPVSGAAGVTQRLYPGWQALWPVCGRTVT